jgi:hypothetical protein
MKRHILILVFLILISAGVLFQFLAIASNTLAQTGNGYDLTWWSVDGGGTTSAVGNGYSLGGTSGQPDAAVWSGGDYTLAGGFWGGAVIEYRIYLPLVLKN